MEKRAGQDHRKRMKNCMQLEKTSTPRKITYRIGLLMNRPRIGPQFTVEELIETGVFGHIRFQQLG